MTADEIRDAISSPGVLWSEWELQDTIRFLLDKIARIEDLISRPINGGIHPPFVHVSDVREILEGQ